MNLPSEHYQRHIQDNSILNAKFIIRHSDFIPRGQLEGDLFDVKIEIYTILKDLNCY